jgi:hypothetical protein
MTKLLLCGCIFAGFILLASPAGAELPDTIAAPGETLVVVVHAQGAQVYECKADTAGKLVWQFREPIAALLIDGKTVGLHFAGPSWELADGSAITGKVTGRAAGATAMDIPLLKLDATPQRESGLLAGVDTIQRLNTKGGVAQGPCEAGTFLNVAYSADYAFYRKNHWSLLPYTIRNEKRRDRTVN